MNIKLFKKRAKQALKSYTKEEIEGINLDNPSIDDLIKIADMGNVTTDWLLGVESQEIVDKVLQSKILHKEIDQCSGKEIKEFLTWSGNYIGDSISEEEFEELYLRFRERRRITKQEKELVSLIYKESIHALLFPKK